MKGYYLPIDDLQNVERAKEKLLASLMLPAGKYVVFAKADIYRVNESKFLSGDSHDAIKLVNNDPPVQRAEIIVRLRLERGGVEDQTIASLDPRTNFASGHESVSLIVASEASGDDAELKPGKGSESPKGPSSAGPEPAPWSPAPSVSTADISTVTAATNARLFALLIAEPGGLFVQVGNVRMMGFPLE